MKERICDDRSYLLSNRRLIVINFGIEEQIVEVSHEICAPVPMNSGRQEICTSNSVLFIHYHTFSFSIELLKFRRKK